MNLIIIKIYLIIFLQIIELLPTIQGNNADVNLLQKDLDQHMLQIIEKNMENQTQPCEHFWNYACGSWTAAPQYDYVDNFGLVANSYADNLIQTLKKLHTVETDSKDLVDQLMTYFLSCKSMENDDTNLNMMLYLKELPVVEIFGESFKWRLIFQESNENIWQHFDWLRAAAYLRKYGFKELLLQESVAFARNNSQQYVIEFKIPQAKVNFQNKYKVLQIMQEFGLIFGCNKTKNYLKLAQELYNFDKELLQLYKTHEHLQQHLFISLQDLPNMAAASNINWYLYLKILLNQLPPAQTPIDFFGNRKYFQDFVELFEKTPRHVQGCYILIRFCQYLRDIRPIITERECLLHTNVMFPLGINYIYNRFLYKNRPQDEQNLQIIFSLLKLEFSKDIQRNKFSLYPAELKYLQNKLKKMELKIGNLPLVLNDINQYYSSVDLSVNHFHYNHLKMLEFRTLQQHGVLLNFSQNLFNLNTYYINDDISQLRNAPYFIHQRNMLIVPMLFLQLPFYHYAQHAVFQFSLAGWIIAHELSHAFDTLGLKFDAAGNENLLGLQLSHKTLFLDTVQCLIDSSPAVSLNERMADVNGLQLAWQTFSYQVANNEEEFNYGNFSLEKIFFLNFAQFFCGTLPRPIAHDRDDVRVRQSVRNIRDFAKVFQCSRAAKENPAEKCSIWRE